MTALAEVLHASTPCHAIYHVQPLQSSNDIGKEVEKSPLEGSPWQQGNDFRLTEKSQNMPSRKRYSEITEKIPSRAFHGRENGYNKRYTEKSQNMPSRERYSTPAEKSPQRPLSSLRDGTRAEKILTEAPSRLRDGSRRPPQPTPSTSTASPSPFTTASPTPTYSRAPSDTRNASTAPARHFFDDSEELDWFDRLADPNEQPIPEEDPNDIHGVSDLTQSILSEKEKNQLMDVIYRNKDAFMLNDMKMGHYTGPYKHRIDLKDDYHIPRRKAYPVPLEQRPELERQLRNLLEQGLIRPSQSPFAAPVLLVAKSKAHPDNASGTRPMRLVIDYRELNKAIRDQHFILPTVQDIVDQAAGCTSHRRIPSPHRADSLHGSIATLGIRQNASRTEDLATRISTSRTRRAS